MKRSMKGNLTRNEKKKKRREAFIVEGFQTLSEKKGEGELYKRIIALDATIESVRTPNDK